MTWQLVALAVGLIVVIPLIWRKPALAVYIMTGAAVTFEIFPLGFPDSFTDTFPFFLNLNNSAGLPLSTTPAEIVMALALAAWITSSAADRAVHRPGRRMLRAYLALVGAVLVAEAWGLLNGGDFNISLWELRPQVYGFIMFLLAASLIRERRQVIILASVFLACSFFKAGIGYYRYSFTLQRNLGDSEAILGHEDSYFLVLFLVATVASAIWARRRRIVLVLLLVSPLVATVMLDNRRRVAMLAVWAAFAVIAGLGIRYEAAIRRRIIIGSAIVVICFGAFLSAYWDAQWGLTGQIVRPFHTLTGQVDQRDYLSDLYRSNENMNIKASYATNPLIGMGFGRPMLLVYPLADISQQYPLWQYMPHNTDLWVAMRMGLVGMAAFWALIATVILEGVRAIRTQEDQLLRGVGAFALAAVVAELVVGYGDVQLENYRNMILLGVMIGLIDALPRMQTATSAIKASLPVWTQFPVHKRSSLSYSE